MIVFHVKPGELLEREGAWQGSQETAGITLTANHWVEHWPACVRRLRGGRSLPELLFLPLVKLISG